MFIFFNIFVILNKVILMKKLLMPAILACIGALIYLNVDKITNYIVNIINNNHELIILDSNKYKKDFSYDFVQVSTDYVPYSYHDIVNIFYNIINNGWNSFTFYCPVEYEECIGDIKSISNNDTLLTEVNNYANPFNSFESIETLYDDTGEVTVTLKKTYSSDDIALINQKIDEMFAKVIKDDMSLKDKLLAAHDYIVNNTKYDTEKNNNGSSKYHSNTAYGVFLEGYATCNGYADAYALVLDRLGVKNYRIASDNHIWNAVYINDNWLHLDLTWDDPVSEDGVNYLYHKYFLINNEQLRGEDKDLTDHIFDSSVYLEFKD